MALHCISQIRTVSMCLHGLKNLISYARKTNNDTMNTT